MRNEVLHDDKGLAFGHDHACGEFLQIWKRPEDPKERAAQDEFGPELDDMLVDKDTAFDKDFNRDEMIRLINLHGFQLEELKAVTEIDIDSLMAELKNLEIFPSKGVTG